MTATKDRKPITRFLQVRYVDSRVHGTCSACSFNEGYIFEIELRAVILRLCPVCLYILMNCAKETDKNGYVDPRQPARKGLPPEIEGPTPGVLK